MSKDYGASIAQSGTPIRFANDYQKILDTRWRPVGTVIAYPVDFVLAAPTGTPFVNVVRIFDHNLGYVPAFEAPRQTDQAAPSPQSTPIGSIFFYADDTSIYVLNRGGLNPRIKGYIYVYDFAINEPYDSEYKGVDLATTSRSTRGVKFIGSTPYATTRIESDDNLGFTVNTNNKQLSVAKVDSFTFVPNNVTFINDIVVNHTIPYPPLIKFAYKLGNTTIQTGFSGGSATYMQFPKETYTSLSQQDVQVYSNAGTQYEIHNYFGALGGIPEATFAYVLFRDPSEVAQ